MRDTSRGGEVQLEIRIDASIATVFGLLTDPSQMKKWLAEVVEVDAQPGGAFRISGPPGLAIEGTYLQVIPNKKVVFTWGGVEGLEPGQSTVEITLEPDGTGTLVRLRHYGLPKSAIEPHRHGWADSGLIKLKECAEGKVVAALCLGDIAHRGGPR